MAPKSAIHVQNDYVNQMTTITMGGASVNMAPPKLNY